MWLGLALFFGSVLFQAAAALGGGCSSVWEWVQSWRLVARLHPGSRLHVPTFRGWLAACAMVHALGIFSFFYLLTEGERCCVPALAAPLVARQAQSHADHLS
jgi:hypothetical protein